MQYITIGGAKAAVVEHRGKNYCFLFNGTAMFSLREKYGPEYLTMIDDVTPDSMEKILDYAYIMAEQGELARRKSGYDDREIPTPEEWGKTEFLQPLDIFTLQNGCAYAMNLGYTREVTDEDEEIDLGLLELQKKNHSRGRSILQMVLGWVSARKKR